LFIHKDIGSGLNFNTSDPIRILHLSFASIAVSSAGFSPIILAHRFRQSKYWRKFSKLSLIFGLLSNLPSFIIFMGLITSTMQNIRGIMEKLSVLIPLLWLIVISINLIRRHGKQLSVESNRIDLIIDQH